MGTGQRWGRVALELVVGVLLVVTAWTASTIAAFALQDEVFGFVTEFGRVPSLVLLAIAVASAGVALALHWAALSAAVLAGVGIAFSLLGGIAGPLMTAPGDPIFDNPYAHPVRALGYAISQAAFEPWLLIHSGTWIAVAMVAFGRARLRLMRGAGPDSQQRTPAGWLRIAAFVLMGAVVVVAAWWIQVAAREALLEEQVEHRRHDWSRVPSFLMLGTAVLASGLLLAWQIAAVSAALVGATAIAFGLLMGPELPNLLANVNDWGTTAGPLEPAARSAVVVGSAGFNSAMLTLAGAWIVIAAFPLVRGPTRAERDLAPQPVRGL